MSTQNVSVEALPGVPSERARAVRDLLRVLVKTQKMLRIYEGGNAMPQRLEGELLERLSSYLDEAGPLVLSVQESALLHEDQVVYESEDRNDSLAFLLFRDGIRRLTFDRGITRDELHRFLTSLNRVSALSSDQDDVVTLFWEQDFKTIRYEVAKEEPGEAAFEGAERTAEDAGQNGSDRVPSGVPSVSLRDLEQPVALLPTEACALTEKEVEALHLELLVEERNDLALSVVELAIELSLLETSTEEQERIARSLIHVLERLLAESTLKRVDRAFEHLAGLALVVFKDESAVTRLYREFCALLATPERIDRLFDRVENEHSIQPAELTALLARLGPEAMACWFPRVERLKGSVWRRAASQAVLAFQVWSLDAVKAALPEGGRPPSEALLTEILFVIRNTPGDGGFPLLERLLRSTNAEGRREVVSVLASSRSEAAHAVLLDLLFDRDPEIRTVALTSLLRSSSPALAPKVLEWTLSTPTFDELPLAERRQIFIAVARLGGEDALPLFERLLRPARARWFPGKRDRERDQIAASGIRAVGTERARAVLEELSRSKDRSVRAACVAAMGEA